MSAGVAFVPGDAVAEARFGAAGVADDEVGVFFGVDLVAAAVGGETGVEARI